MAYFKSGDHRLAYTVYGDGPRTTVLLPGLLFSQRMHVPLARALSDRGNRVVTLDLLGHGKSDRPQDMRVYSMDQFAEQTLALLDHLEIDQAVVGGTSLGANVTLSTASLVMAAPSRVHAGTVASSSAIWGSVRISMVPAYHSQVISTGWANRTPWKTHRELVSSRPTGGCGCLS